MKLREFSNAAHLNTLGEGLPVIELTQQAYPDIEFGKYLRRLRTLQTYYNIGVFGGIVFGVLFLLPYILPLQLSSRVADVMITSLLLMMLTGGVALWAGTKICKVYDAELGRYLAVVHEFAPGARTMDDVLKDLLFQQDIFRNGISVDGRSSGKDPARYQEIMETLRFFRLIVDDEEEDDLNDGTGNGPDNE